MTVNIEISNAFNHHATTYEQSAIVQQEIGRRLFERLQYLNMKPRYILDVGCGPGTFLTQLKRAYPDAVVVGLDLAYQMLFQAKNKQTWRQKWGLVNADMMALPFMNGQFDLVFANQVVHWSTSFPSLMTELNRVLRHEGCLMFSTLGPDTFQELRTAFAAADKYTHTNDFMDMHDIGDCLLQEFFQDPVVDMEMLTAHYQTLLELMVALKKQGVRNIHRERNRGLTGKTAWKKFEQIMQANQTETGKLPLTYEVIYGHAWKGEQSRTAQGVETRISVNKLLGGYKKPPYSE